MLGSRSARWGASLARYATASSGRFYVQGWRTICVATVTVATLAAATSSIASQPFTACPNSALRTGTSSSTLPDCRAYEQVSPVDKGGYNAVGWASLAAAQTSPNGVRLSYRGYTPFPGAQGNDVFWAEHMAERTTSGWRNHELTTAAPEGTPKQSYMVGYVFSPELTETLVKIPLVLAPNANPTVFNLYLRNLEGEAGWLDPVYSWVNDAPLPAPAKETCIGEPGSDGCAEDTIAFAGASTDFRHVLFETDAQLEPDAPPSGVPALYESDEGTVRLVGVLPDGAVATSGATAGAGSKIYYPFTDTFKSDLRVEHAVSADGGRVVFQAQSDEGEPYEKGQGGLSELYDRIEGRSTVEISAPAVGATPANPAAESAHFWTASADGGRVFFTSKAELTTTSNTGPSNEGEDLYEYNLSSKALTDLTVDTNPADSAAGANVLGVVDASENGELIYFVAAGQLVPGKGVDGKPNLYMERNGGRPVFIATLQPANTTSPEAEAHERGDSLDWTPYAEPLQAYVPPDGLHLAFMSMAKPATVNFPAGYDNADQMTGAADSEVYEYSAPTVSEENKGATGELRCVSCDPTGRRPTGPAFIAGAGETPGGPTTANTAYYHVKSVSDSGSRVFFEAPPYSSELAIDSKETGYLKIYEYESEGTGSCRAAEGCVTRLSGRSNPSQDLFLDASREGEDVFFATYSRLAASDRDSLMDVYDARIGGGFPVPTVPAACGDECREPQALPPAPTLVSGFTGPSGNLLAPPTSVGTQYHPHRKRSNNGGARARRHVCEARARRIKQHRRRVRALNRCASRARGSRLVAIRRKQASARDKQMGGTRR